MKSSLSNTVETTPFSWMKMTSQCVLSSCTAIWAQFLDVAVMLGGLAYIPIREATNDLKQSVSILADKMVTRKEPEGALSAAQKTAPGRFWRQGTT